MRGVGWCDPAPKVYTGPASRGVLRLLPLYFSIIDPLPLLEKTMGAICGRPTTRFIRPRTWWENVPHFRFAANEHLTFQIHLRPFSGRSNSYSIENVSG